MKRPTDWQIKAIYAALTALSILALCWVAKVALEFIAYTAGKFQVFLIPLAVAGVLAYLLEPVVLKLTSWKLTRTAAVLIVFGVFIIGGALVVLWVGPTLYDQTVKFAGNDVPDLVQKAWNFTEKTMGQFQQSQLQNEHLQPLFNSFQDWLKSQLPNYANTVISFLKASVAGGVLGVFGYILGLVAIPFYLFYFLQESAGIQKNWSNYLPIQASHFKDEVVGTLTEINGYLVAFFRGQLLVSAIDGVLIGTGLVVMGLKFGVLIGLMVAVLGLIPYLGLFLCWVPAVVIAAGQYQDWTHPVLVTCIFILMNQLESWLISPRIVGNSVGLHPLTVIASVIVWSVVLGGLLGAILAVPLTATMKVLLRRYVWHRKFKAPGAA